VKGVSTRATSEKLITIAAFSGLICSIMPIACRLASSRRDGPISVAAMLADVSIRKMNRLPSSFDPCQPGRSSVNMSKAIKRSCKKSSKLCRKRCQSELTCKSSIARLHRYVLGTASGSRRSFKK